ncbi:YfiR family protein [Psychrobium sp. 1_MG-2023]|uniref:YfiR family protein n=1 Tax=Psychrobium sp. 1_MG-2023 TaxID=3062624 RepID=UPI000C3401CA|nr:YfiR family protein [Psychrobium sp. 1_MG-2023]MDP2561212.1 YfiR family protein [Psychrobium sp. 1_MG-2023]PKF55284.1 hypothetical protein CW748_13780 [Alteromonadales bacterium alter-6D02]
MAIIKTKSTHIINTIMHSIVVGVVFGLCLFPSKSFANNSSQEQLTAAFVYQITKFAQWPKASQSLPNNSFSICIFGEPSPTLRQYFRALEQKTTQGKPITYSEFMNKQQLKNSNASCQILYIINHHQEHLNEQDIINLSKNTLLIGQSKAFLAQGGMLSLVIINRKMKILISQNNIERSNIKLQPRLKALAKVI